MWDIPQRRLLGSTVELRLFRGDVITVPQLTWLMYRRAIKMHHRAALAYASIYGSCNLLISEVFRISSRLMRLVGGSQKDGLAGTVCVPAYNVRDCLPARNDACQVSLYSLGPKLATRRIVLQGSRFRLLYRFLPLAADPPDPPR